MKGIAEEDESQFILDVLEERPQNVSGPRTEYRVETENSEYTVAEEKVNNHSIISIRQNDRLVSMGIFSITDDQTGEYEVAEIGESYVAEEIEDMDYADPISFMSGETDAEINKTSTGYNMPHAPNATRRPPQKAIEMLKSAEGATVPDLAEELEVSRSEARGFLRQIDNEYELGSSSDFRYRILQEIDSDWRNDL